MPDRFQFDRVDVNRIRIVRLVAFDDRLFRMPIGSRANSDAAFARARKVMPGGVNSPVRAFKAVGGNPVFIKEGEGCRVTDVDGNQYVDYVMSYGPLIAGHANERIVAAVSKAAGRGSCYGMPCELETHLATLVADAVDSIEVVRFVNSGTEAAMSAIRLARAATGRELIIKCQGCYHGHVDALLVEAGSGALTLGVPSSPGIPQSIVRTTLNVPYNDLQAAKGVFEQFPKQIACFAVEPIAGNMGLISPAPGYLQGLRELCDQHGTVLLFDEVMTGFRVAWGGAQSLYDVAPDVTCLGKIIGGGLPVGAFGGRADVMATYDPTRRGTIAHSGTFNGNAATMAAGLATLARYDHTAVAGLNTAGDAFRARLNEVVRAAGIEAVVAGYGSLMQVHFRAAAPPTPEASADGDGRLVKLLHLALLTRGVFIATRGLVVLSTPMTAADLDLAADRFAAALRAVAQARPHARVAG